MLGVYQHGLRVWPTEDSEGNIGKIVDRLSKMAHLEAVPDSIDGKVISLLFIDRVFRQNGSHWQLSLT